MGDTKFGTARPGRARGFAFAMICLAALAGCSKSDSGNDAADTSRLPRVSGAKEVFASAPTTIFNSPLPVAQTADTLGKALAAIGWQSYVAPNTAYSNDAKLRTISLKKGAQALNVFITIAPAQNNATSVQYSFLPLKNDLPFPKDATNIEFDPNRPLLSAITAESIDNTLNFYRSEMGARGWQLWSEKLNAKQPAGGPSGKIHERGGSADYVNGKESTVALVLTMQRAEAGRFKVEVKAWPIGILASEHKAYLNAPNQASLIDVSRLPRLEGAKVDLARAASTRLSYTVLGSFEDTVAATKKILATDGWKEYASPSEAPNRHSMQFKKGPQGLSVFFTMPAGEPVHSGVDYSPNRLSFDLPVPDDADDMVFDANRPYLNCVSAGTIDANLAFFDKTLPAMGWSRLSATAAVARWPNAKLDETVASGARAYYISDSQRPILLSLQRGADGKTQVEIKIAPFALPQMLEAGTEVYGMPTPKISIGSGGTRDSAMHEVHATVPAEVGSVLAFYRGELAKRNWKEETAGAVVNPDKAVLAFSSADGMAGLKLNHKYDLTTVSLVLQVKEPAVKPAAKEDSVDEIMKQAQQAIRQANIEALTPPKSPAASNRPTTETKVAQAAVSGGDAKGAPVPVPADAEDVEYEAADGRLEFSSAASVKSLADFYRAEMKQAGWQERTSVINRLNMVVLNFSKSDKAVSFTIMQMGAKANVSADGSGLKTAAAASADKPQSSAAAAAAAPEPGDLDVEESGGLPVPKRHTMSEGSQTQFRHGLKASVPLDLTAVLGFYRSELGKRGWKEASGAVVATDRAVISYTSPAGSGVLKLARKDGATSVELAVRDSAKAAQAGLAPKPGQVKVLIGNILDTAAEVTIAKQTIKVGAHVGVKKPDGPTLELAPGKYKVSVKGAGGAMQSEDVEVAADETWGLMIGPGGILPMHVY
jgi:hypothetical protein